MVKSEDKELQVFTHAKHDPAHVLAPGLFRSLSKGDYKKQKLDVVYEFGQGERLEFGGKEPLGVPELRILQGLIAMAGPNGIILGPEPKTEEGRQLRLLLETKFDAVHEDALVAKGSFYTLASAIGMSADGGKNYKLMRESIERLWGVSVIAEKNGKRRGFRLLSEYATDERKEQLFVALNPRIAACILGDARHCRIELSEVRQLESDSTRILHQRLCGWIDQGKSGKASLETLISYVWSDDATDAAIRKRRQRIREALAELHSIGWTVDEYEKKLFEIHRPEAPL